MAPRTDRTTCIPPGVASPVTTSHAAKGSVFVNLITGDNFFKMAQVAQIPHIAAVIFRNYRERAPYKLDSHGWKVTFIHFKAI